MSRRMERRLSCVRKAMLAAGRIAAAAAGIVSAPPILAQSNKPRPAFEVGLR